MARKNNALADQVASDMLGIMGSEEHKEIFGPTVGLKKSASLEGGEDENDAKGMPPWLKKDDDDGDKKDDDKKDDGDKGEKKDDDKDEKDDKDDEKKDDKKEDEDDCQTPTFPFNQAQALQVSIDGLAKISEALDQVGIEKGAAATLQALEVLVSEAAVLGEADALGVPSKDLNPEIVAELVGEKSPKA